MFYITVSNGLLKDGHRKRMGEAVWEFMWCIDRVTRIDEFGKGWVLGGKPIKLRELAQDMGVHFTTVSRNLAKLKDQGYLELKYAPNGIIILVNKAKKRFSTNAKGFSRNATRFSKNAKPNIRQVSIDNIKDKEGLEKLRGMKRGFSEKSSIQASR